MAPWKDMVVEAIAGLKERNGSSSAAIKKFIEANHPDVKFAPHFLKAALQKGVEAGSLVKVKASYKLSAQAKAAATAKSKRAAKAAAEEDAPAASQRAGKTKKKAPAAKGKGKGKRAAAEQSPEDVASLNEALYEAARGTDEARIRELVSQGADVNTLWATDTPLHKATNSPPNIMATLLELGANPNVPDELNGLSVLQLLCGFTRDTALVEVLLDGGADIEFKDDFGRTPLHCACGNVVQIATTLLERGANINAVDSSGHTPLATAARKNNAAVVKLLMERGGTI